MELINATRMVAGYTMGIEPSGRELLVVVIKGTFRIPTEPGAALRLHEEQLPLVMADVYHGEPGLSAPKLEVDFAPRKHRCDILLNGSAYAQGGRPTERIAVGMKIGNWTKSMIVVGDRVWQSGSSGVTASPPQPFTVMPITYDRAFGGTDNRHEDPAKHAAYMPNPVGRGFHKNLEREFVDGAPLPNTEELGVQIERPDGQYKPMSFGVFGRNWDPRYRYAGTYDQDWLDNTFPFLPKDFDEQYYQAAPVDQQLPVPLGQQEVTLVNLTVDGRRSFLIPYFEAPVHVFLRKGDREDWKAMLDTVVLQLDHEYVTLTWRVAHPLKKDMFEIAQILVGKKGKEWWQQREQVAFPIPIAVVSMDPDTREPHYA